MTLASLARADDIYVDASNTAPPFLGTAGDPYQTITDALGHPPSSGDIILVAPGSYTEALGEAFPLQLPTDIQVRGDAGTRPVLGGDVNDDGSTVASIFFIGATTGDRTNVVIQNFVFATEDNAGKNAPCAVLVDVREGFDATGIVIDNCAVQRLGMDGVASGQRPAIEFRCGFGTLEVDVTSCDITPSTVGGLGATIDEGTSSENSADVDVFVSFCTIEYSGSGASDYGIRLAGIGVDSDDQKFARIRPTLVRNTIDSSQATGDGIETGILLEARGAGSGSVKFQVADTIVSANEIIGMNGDGIVFSVDAETDSGGEGYITTDKFHSNIVRNCGGSGCVADFGPGTGSGISKYLHIESHNNMYVDNGGHGILLKQAGTEGSNGGGLAAITNDTIANNSGHGVYSDSSSVDHLPDGNGVQNNIVYYNNGGTYSYPEVQIANAGSWTPAFNYCCVLGWTSGGTGNTGEEPGFTNAGSGVYTLTTAGDDVTVDQGTNNPSAGLLAYDLAGSARLQEGDCESPRLVDMGAYELDGDCP